MKLSKSGKELLRRAKDGPASTTVLSRILPQLNKAGLVSIVGVGNGRVTFELTAIGRGALVGSK